MKITDKTALAALEPAEVMRWFMKLTEIPRPSNHEEKIAGWLCDFAKARGLDVYTDETRNVFMKKPGQCGGEKAGTVLLQGHTDMVCEKNRDVTIDFFKDPLRVYAEDGKLRAEGTTLGGDDGVAVACMLALLDSKDIPHPPLECLFTAAEETGLDGATGFDASRITARKMINMDSEALHEIVSGCAGGVRTDLTFRTRAFFLTKEDTGLEISVLGLMGGHSGENIADGIPNANKVMGRLLCALWDQMPFRMYTLCGGAKDNAIPRECTAGIALTRKRKAEAVKFLTKTFETIRNEWPDRHKGARLEIRDTVPLRAWNELFTCKIIRLLGTVDNGVFEMHRSIPGLVGWSRNLGVIQTLRTSLRFVFSTRSDRPSQIDASCTELSGLGEIYGAEVKHYARYPGWIHREDSALRELWMQTFRDKTGEDMRNLVIHAGLECGILSEKCPQLDIISVGPDLSGIHSPDEALDIASLGVFWNVLLAVLDKLCKKQ